MSRTRISPILLLFVFSVGLPGLSIAQEGAAVRNTLETIFNPRRAPAEKSMGLAQRSFLDIVETRHAELKVALVIDGTDSMSEQFDAVRAAMTNMVEDLRRYKGDHVSFQVVVYRDTGSKSGSVTRLFKNFTKDLTALKEALAAVKTESGAPYFFEAVDLGIHEALTIPDWGQDDETARWLMVFGDAPPFEEGFREEKTGARRFYDTDILVDLAKSKGVQVNCILCPTRAKDKEVYAQVLDQTQSFMGRLSSKTGGVMLDLSYPDIRKAVADAAKKTRVEHRPIRPILQSDIEAAKQQAHEEESPVATNRRLRIAVLPHTPFDRVRFDSSLPEMKVATELRQKFRMLPTAEVRSPTDVNRQMRRVKTRRMSDAQKLQTLAAGLRVDYVIWGSYNDTAGTVRLQTSIYDARDGKALGGAQVATGQGIKAVDLASRMMVALAERVPANPRDQMLAALVPLRNDIPLRDALVTPVSGTEPARSDLLIGYDNLEQALGILRGQAESKPLLEKAEASLNKAVTQGGEAGNPLAHLLLTSCRYNLAYLYLEQKNDAEYKRLMKRYSESLKRAYRDRAKSKFQSIQTEIEAEYLLFIKQDFPKAIELFKKLTAVKDESPLYQARRGHWYLAGIYSGDWGAKDMVDVEQARHHLIQILAHWPDSPEAKIIRDRLRWSEVKGGSQFNQVAEDNYTLVGAIDRSPLEDE